jgi:uncharacterized protein involved in exopolysaccharide biosynthesis
MTDRAPQQDRTGDYGLMALVVAIFRFRKQALWTTGGFLALALLFVLFGRGWSAQTTFEPESSDVADSKLAGIAAQFGIRAPSAGATDNSSDFYVSLLTSRGLLLAAAREHYPALQGGTDSTGGMLLERLSGTTTPTVEDEQNAVAWLLKHTSVSTDIRTDIVLLKVTVSNPALAEQLADRMVALVGQFNLTRRQTSAASERNFAAERIHATKEDLNQAEDAMARFLEANRDFHSPRLTFQQARLQREVDTRQQILLTLLQSFETSSIDAVRNTPVITVIDHAAGSAQRDVSGVKVIILALIGGGAAGIFVALVYDLLRWAREEKGFDLWALIKGKY